MKRIIGTVVLVATMFMFIGSPASAQFLAEDDGRCALGLLSAHAAHEWGHDFGAIAAGGSPWRPGVIWGNKWDESQRNFRWVASSGFKYQHLYAAFSAATPEDSFSQCAVHGSTIISGYYAMRAKLTPDDSGDYDPFPAPKRKEITVIDIAFSLFLEGLTESNATDEQWIRSHSSVFDFQSIFIGQ
ncbi:MAG: hypothetical protein HYW91_01685 [Candidatus Sungbacteria bacterium]|nr:hypothetical protein [Candidatus Sungbacteria bacterium]